MPTNKDFIFLTPAEEKKYFASIDSLRDRTIVKTILDTGLFVSEILLLSFDDVDLEKKLIKVKGKRQRLIPLNEELTTLFKQYYETRPACDTNIVFLSGRGKPAPLSHRSIDKLLHKYYLQSGLAKKINAISLRNTFAVKLFLAKLPYDEIVAILGISHDGSLARYARVAGELKDEQGFSQKIEFLDNRSLWQKLWSSFNKRNIPIPAIHDNQPIKKTDIKKGSFIGRANMLANIRRDLSRRQSVLIIGSYGLGRTAMLQELLPHFVAGDNTVKNVLTAILTDSNIPIPSRTSVSELFQLLGQLADPIIPFDNIDKSRKENCDLIERNLDKYPFVLTAENYSTKLERIKNKVNVYELKPLTDEEMKELIRSRINSLTIAPQQEKLLFNHIKTIACGNPGAANNMLDMLARVPRVTDDYIRSVYDDSGQKVRDWSALMVIVFSGMIILRYFARGTGDTELYIIAGTFAALLGVFKSMRWMVRKS